jgi:hypothetical protein
MKDELRIYLRADGQIAERFWRIKEHLGLKNDTEVVRSLINWYWGENQEKLQPPLEHFNIWDEGVRILDRTIDKPRGYIVDVYFKPDSAWCEYCDSTKCQHVRFALEIPEVQKILKEKGWKIRLE